jgi:hypothetical protein
VQGGVHGSPWSRNCGLAAERLRETNKRTIIEGVERKSATVDDREVAQLASVIVGIGRRPVEVVGKEWCDGRVLAEMLSHIEREGDAGLRNMGLVSD